MTRPHTGGSQTPGEPGPHVPVWRCSRQAPETPWAAGPPRARLAVLQQAPENLGCSPQPTALPPGPSSGNPWGHLGMSALGLTEGLCTPVRVCTRACICVQVSVYVYTCACFCVCLHMCVCMCASVCRCPCVCVCVYTCVCASVCTRVCTCVLCAGICTCVCMHACLCVCVCEMLGGEPRGEEVPSPPATPWPTPGLVPGEHPSGPAVPSAWPGRPLALWI